MLLIVKYSEYDYVMSDIYLVHICTERIYYKKTNIYYKIKKLIHNRPCHG